MTTEYVKDIVKRHYGIDMVSVEKLTPGSYSEVCLLTDSNDNRYLLKKYRGINNFDLSQLTTSLEVQDFIASQGFAPQLLKTKTEQYVAQDKSCFTLMEYVEGQIFKRKSEIDNDNWSQLGVKLAEIHKSLRNYEGDMPSKAKCNLNPEEIEINNELKNEVIRQLNEVERLAPYITELYKQPTHGDPSIDNWIFTDNGPVLIDWDTSSTATVELDLLFFDGSGLNDFIRSYQSQSSHQIDGQALKYYLLTHQLNLLDTRIKQHEEDELEAESVTKFFYSLSEVEAKVERFLVAKNL